MLTSNDRTTTCCLEDFAEIEPAEEKEREEKSTAFRESALRRVETDIEEQGADNQGDTASKVPSA